MLCLWFKLYAYVVEHIAYLYAIFNNIYLFKVKTTTSDMVPAVTLSLDDASIDLVPAIKIKGWPSQYSDRKPGWIDKGTRDAWKMSYHAVPKIHWKGK